MLERLEDYFLTEPERLIGLGRALVYLGGMLIMFGLVGHVATSAANGIGIIGGHADTVKTLADIYPSLPTWWVPESIIGALPAIVTSALGIWLTLTGKRLRRLIGRRR
jgi:hypothetical protein